MAEEGGEVSATPSVVRLTDGFRLLRPWSNAPPVQLLSQQQAAAGAPSRTEPHAPGHAPCRMLLLSPGDARNLVASLAVPQPHLQQVAATLCDDEPVILARAALLLLLHAELDPDKWEDMCFLWEVWFNTCWSSQATAMRLKHFLQKLLAGVPWLSLGPPQTEQAITLAWQAWLHRMEKRMHPLALLAHKDCIRLPRLHALHRVPYEAPLHHHFMPQGVTELDRNRAHTGGCQGLKFGEAAHVHKTVGRQPMMEPESGKEVPTQALDAFEVLVNTVGHYRVHGNMWPNNEASWHGAAINVTLLDLVTGHWSTHWDVEVLDCWGPFTIADIAQEATHPTGATTSALQRGQAESSLTRACVRRMARQLREFQAHACMRGAEAPRGSSNGGSKTQLQVELLMAHPLQAPLPRAPLLYDVVDAGTLADEAGLLPVLAVTAPLLAPRPQSRLHTGTVKWAGAAWTLQEYLDSAVGVEPTLFPTLLGLHLLTDLASGRPTPLDRQARFVVPGADPRALVWAPAARGPLAPWPLPTLHLPLDCAAAHTTQTGDVRWGPPGSLAAALQALASRCCQTDFRSPPLADDVCGLRGPTPHTLAYLAAFAAQRMDLAELAGVDAPLAASLAQLLCAGECAAAPGSVVQGLRALRSTLSALLPPPFRISFQACMDLLATAATAAAGGPDGPHSEGPDEGVDPHSPQHLPGVLGVLCELHATLPELPLQAPRLRVCLLPAHYAAHHDPRRLALQARLWATATPAEQLPPGVHLLEVCQMARAEPERVHVMFLLPHDHGLPEDGTLVTVVDVTATHGPHAIFGSQPLSEVACELVDKPPRLAGLLATPLTPSRAASPQQAADEQDERAAGQPPLQLTGFTEQADAYVLTYQALSSVGQPDAAAAEAAVRAAVRVAAAEPEKAGWVLGPCALTATALPQGPGSGPLTLSLAWPVRAEGGQGNEAVTVQPGAEPGTLHVQLRKAQAWEAWPDGLPAPLPAGAVPGPAASQLPGLLQLDALPPFKADPNSAAPKEALPDAMRRHCEAQFSIPELDAISSSSKGSRSGSGGSSEGGVAAGRGKWDVRVRRLIQAWLQDLVSTKAISRRAVVDGSGNIELLVQLHGPPLMDANGRPVVPVTVYDRGHAVQQYQQGAWKQDKFGKPLQRVMGKGCLGPPGATSGYHPTTLPPDTLASLKQLLYHNAQASVPTSWQQTHLPPGFNNLPNSPFLASYLAPLYSEHLVAVKQVPHGFFCVSTASSLPQEAPQELSAKAQLKQAAKGGATGRKQGGQGAVWAAMSLDEKLRHSHMMEREAKIIYQPAAAPLHAATTTTSDSNAPSTAAATANPQQQQQVQPSADAAGADGGAAAAPAAATTAGNRKARKRAEKQARKQQQQQEEEEGLDLEDLLQAMYGSQGGEGRTAGDAQGDEAPAAGDEALLADGGDGEEAAEQVLQHAGEGHEVAGAAVHMSAEDVADGDALLEGWGVPHAEQVDEQALPASQADAKKKKKKKKKQGQAGQQQADADGGLAQPQGAVVEDPALQQLEELLRLLGDPQAQHLQQQQQQQQQEAAGIETCPALDMSSIKHHMLSPSAGASAAAAAAAAATDGRDVVSARDAPKPATHPGAAAGAKPAASMGAGAWAWPQTLGDTSPGDGLPAAGVQPAGADEVAARDLALLELE